MAPLIHQWTVPVWGSMPPGTTQQVGRKAAALEVEEFVWIVLIPAAKKSDHE